VRNSLLVELSWAEDKRDSSTEPKLRVRRQRRRRAVEERCTPDRSGTVRSRGRSASENAGMSSDKEGENPSRRKPKVSWARQVHPGLAGP